MRVAIVNVIVTGAFPRATLGQEKFWRISLELFPYQGVSVSILRGNFIDEDYQFIAITYRNDYLP